MQETVLWLPAGPGEPIATAAGVLGIMAIWRCFYAAFLDYFNFRQWGLGGTRTDRLQVQADQSLCILIASGTIDQ